MNYTSPITVVFDKIKSQIDDDIISVIQSYKINVDKKELLNALQYDRNQYENGYNDGLRDGKFIAYHELKEFLKGKI